MAEACSVCSEAPGFVCSGCGPKCLAHVRRRREKRLRLVCMACGSDASVRRVRRDQTTSFQARFKPTLLGTVLGRPLLAIVPTALLLSTSHRLGLLGLLFGLVPLLILAARNTRQAADGEAFDWPPLAEAADEIGRPLARLATALAPGLLLVFLGVFHGVVLPWQIAAERTHTLEGALLIAPSFWLTMLPALAYVPLALVSSMLANQWWDGLDARPWPRWVRARAKAFGWISLVTLGAFVVAFFLRWLFSGWFGAFSSALVASWAVVAVARLSGDLVWLQPDAFGWGRDDDAFIELGDPNAVALEEEKPVVAAARSELTTSLEAQLTVALDEKYVQLVLKLHAEHKAEAEQLPAKLLLRVGQAAASVEAYAQAMEALLAAAKGAEVEASRALVIAARILDERLRDYAGAKRLYQQAVERFPGTQAAAYSQKQLADSRFFLRQAQG